MEKEHFEIILEDINSKFNLFLENFQSLRDKMEENNLDSIRRDEEIIKLLKFAKEDSDRRNDETNQLLKLTKEDLGKRIDNTNKELRLTKEELNKRIDETNKELKLTKEDLGKRIDDTNRQLKIAKEDLGKRIDDLSKKIQGNGLQIVENRRLIERNGEKLELFGEKQFDYEKRLAQLEKRTTND